MMMWEVVKFLFFILVFCGIVAFGALIYMVYVAPDAYEYIEGSEAEEDDGIYDEWK